MGMEAINGFSPLIQQAQPQAKTQAQESSQSQSEIANSESNGSLQSVEVKVEAADNSAGTKDDALKENLESNQEAIKAHLEESEEKIQADNAKVKKAISEMAKNMTSNAEAVFGIHEKTNRVTIKMVDKDTKKVIKEFPPEATLDMIAKVWEIAGIMVDEKR